MPKRKTHEEFIEEMKIVNPNIEILGKYVNNKVKILCKCKIDKYEWESKPNSLLNGHGCPKCAIKRRTLGSAKSHEQFLSEMKCINPDIEILGQYTNALEKINCKCRIDGYEWSTTPNILLEGHGCPMCGRKYVSDVCRYTMDTFKEKLHKINQNIEVISNEYINSKTDVLVHCKIHDFEWSAKPNALLLGHGCPKCGAEKISLKLRLPNDDFVEKLLRITDNIEPLEPYVTSKHNIKCRCKICQHIWKPTPNSLLSGEGCPECANQKPKSTGEVRALEYFNSQNINYIKNKKYDDLLGINGGLLSYDFYLPDYNLLIECQGQQHEKPVSVFGGEEQFKIQQEHDKRKREYAKEHNIELFEIWYYDYKNIENILEKYKESSSDGSFNMQKY